MLRCSRQMTSFTGAFLDTVHPCRPHLSACQLAASRRCWRALMCLCPPSAVAAPGLRLRADVLSRAAVSNVPFVNERALRLIKRRAVCAFPGAVPGDAGWSRRGENVPLSWQVPSATHPQLMHNYRSDFRRCRGFLETDARLHCVTPSAEPCCLDVDWFRSSVYWYCVTLSS